MHYKVFSVIFICAIVLMTIVGLKTDTSIKKIRIQNQGFEVSNAETKIANTDVEISLSESKLNNRAVSTSSKANIKINDSKLGNKNINLAGKNLKNQDLSKPNQTKKTRHYYKNISWNEWKSSFINQFLDDLSGVPSLNNYGIGSWFYYSFDVMNDGSIKNINVFSFYLNNRDRLAIVNVIKNYEYQDITVFPQNSKRKKAKIDAFVVLSTEESRTNPSDFHDNERVKLEY